MTRRHSIRTQPRSIGASGGGGVEIDVLNSKQQGQIFMSSILNQAMVHVNTLSANGAENELYGTIVRLIRLLNRPDLLWERLGMGNILRKWFPTLEPQSVLKQTVLVLGEYISGQFNLAHAFSIFGCVFMIT